MPQQQNWKKWKAPNQHWQQQQQQHQHLHQHQEMHFHLHYHSAERGERDGGVGRLPR
jgi:hypothetical protein